MKFNLKNRPPLEDFKPSEIDPKVEQEIQQCIEWFEGFEKELRELKEIIEHYGEDQKNPHRLYEHLKDVLGEEASS